MHENELLMNIMNPDKMVTITICSPLRNSELIDKYTAFYTALGNLVLTPVRYDLISKESKDQEKDLKNLHMIHHKKIEMADAILIINKDGYIGNDTKREMMSSSLLAKPVMYTNKDDDISEYYFNNNETYPIYICI